MEVTNKYLFKILWSQTYIAIAINELYEKNYDIPLTTFYFWPREDGWKLLKSELDSKPWLIEKSKLEILNGYTLLINFWLKNINQKTNILKQTTNHLNLNLDILAINSMD
jgi:30S ribosomal protein 3